jgi:hypothetical protein
MVDKRKFKTKRRPRRLFYDEKVKKYFYLINNKKKYIKIDNNIPPKANEKGKDISPKEIARVNIQNILPVSVIRKTIKPRSSIKPITNQQIVSKLVPIAPVSANLTGLYKPSEDLEKKITKIEQQLKEGELVKPKEKEEEKKESKTSIGSIFKPSKPPKATTLAQIIRARNESEKQIIIDAEKSRINDMNAVYKGFVETNPPPDVEDEGDISLFTKFAKPFKAKKHVKVEDFLEQAKFYSLYPAGIFPSFEYFSDEIFPKLTGYNKPSFPVYSKAKKIFEERKIPLTRIDELEVEVEEPLLKKEGNITSFVGRGIATFMRNMYGSGMYENDDDGTFNTELQEIFKDKMNKFLPVIPADRMDELLPLVNKDTKKFGWIQNTENSGSMGRHWVAYFIDIPNMEINYYDSLVENDGQPTKESLRGIKKIIDKIHPEYYLLFKYNLVQDQSPSSKNCGYFALKFIMDRYRNVPFKEASGYDKFYDEGEKMIKRFKKYL